MDKRDLQLTAGRIITDSKLSKPAKLQLLKWVRMEASVPQIKVFLMDGEIVQLDEQAEQIVESRFIEHRLNEGGWASLAGIIFSPGGWLIYRTIRAGFDAKSKKCGVYGIGRERDVCLWKLRVDEAKKMIGIIKKETGNCSKAANPEACKTASVTQIAKWKDKMEKNLAKIKTYSQKSAMKNFKTKQGLKKAADPSTKAF